MQGPIEAKAKGLQLLDHAGVNAVNTACCWRLKLAQLNEIELLLLAG